MSRMFNPPHPGEVLQAYLPEGTSVTGAAQKLGVSRQALSVILKVSDRMRGDFSNLSERKLMDCLTRLGFDV